MNCLYCKDVELEITDSINTEFSGDYARENVTGFCPICGKDFMWDIIYKLSNEDNCEEI